MCCPVDKEQASIAIQQATLHQWQATLSSTESKIPYSCFLTLIATILFPLVNFCCFEWLDSGKKRPRYRSCRPTVDLWR